MEVMNQPLTLWHLIGFVAGMASLIPLICLWLFVEDIMLARRCRKNMKRGVWGSCHCGKHFGSHE